MNNDSLSKLYSVTSHLDTASVEDISSILNEYSNNGFNEPRIADRLNARYRELTGQDHPVYMEQAPKVIDEYMKDKSKLIRSGVYNQTFFERLQQIQDGLSGKEPRVEYAEGHHPIQDFTKVLQNLDKATAEQISQQLNYFNGKPVIVNGTVHPTFNDPITAARLNARYKELTGQDHPIYMDREPKVIDEYMKDKSKLIRSGVYTSMYFGRLQQIQDGLSGKGPGLEFVEGHHPIQDHYNVTHNLDKATAEQISQQLDYFNGKSVTVNGTIHPPFSNPVTATRLNTRYRELTGQDHPVYMEQEPKVIDEYMKNKLKLILLGTYSPMYFDKLQQIKDDLLERQQNVQSTVINVKPSQSDFYEQYRHQMMQSYLEKKEPGTVMHSSFNVINGEKPTCNHKLERVNENGRELLQSHTFDYDDNFKQNILLQSVSDYAQCSPILDTGIMQQENGNVNVQVMGENNNVLTVNNVEPELATSLNTTVQQTPPMVYEQAQQQMAMQQDMGGPQLTMTLGSMNGYVKIWILGIITTFISLGIIILGMLFR